MRVFGKYIQVILFICLVTGTLSAYAQPATVTAETDLLYRHGRNSTGPDTDENTDSVTLDGTTKYYYHPDAAVNTGFAVPFTSIASTFSWTVTNAIASGGAAAVLALPANYKQVTWTGTGLGTIQVTETSNLACAGDPVSIPVEVIAKPNVTGISISNPPCTSTPVSVACPNATLTVTSSVKGNKNIKVSYEIVGPGSVSVADDTDVPLSGTGELDLSAITLTSPGAYVLTITGVTDRIATKCGLTGVDIVETENKTFFVTITPTTGKTKHVPNDAGW